MTPKRASPARAALPKCHASSKGIDIMVSRSELKGRTLGIVGVGRIGSEVAMRALAFGMDVVGFDPYVGDERFRGLSVATAGGVVTVSGRVKSRADVWAYAAAARNLPGVTRVVVGRVTAE